jgi:ubiquinone/menaquinone biosynthesis C-methylase UbiE
MRRFARRLFYLPFDMMDVVTGRRNAMIPPRGMIFTGSGDFVRSGKALVELCIKEAGLTPASHVLDVGCGIGRLAVPLTQYITSGTYNGFDVVPDGIEWCKRKITPLYPNFTFTYIPLRNDLYNLDTINKAEQFIFPYTDNTFDLVVLTSVFTHMQYNEVLNYLQQISRVLKPGGRCLATFFIIDESTREMISQRRDVMQFDYEYDTYFLHDNKVKDANIAFKQDALTGMISKAGLRIQTLGKGWWRGTDREQSFNFQDVLILEK